MLKYYKICNVSLAYQRRKNFFTDYKVAPFKYLKPFNTIFLNFEESRKSTKGKKEISIRTFLNMLN